MKLTKLQQQVLGALGRSELADFFYWTGGTLLSARYLHHRYSEDLDFFSTELMAEEMVLAAINRIKKTLRLGRVQQTVRLNRQQYLLRKGRERLKLEFVYFPFPPLIRPKKTSAWPVRIDSLKDLAVNKLFALYERGEPKDAVDVFYILKKQKWALAQLGRAAHKKFGVEIDQAQLASRALEAADRLSGITPLFSKKVNIKNLQHNIESFFRSAGKRYLSKLLS